VFHRVKCEKNIPIGIENEMTSGLENSSKKEE